MDWVQVPHGGLVGPRKGAGYCIQMSAGVDIRMESTGGTIYQAGDHGGVPHQLFQVIAGSGYHIGRGGGMVLDSSNIIPKPVNDQNHQFNIVATGGAVHDVRFYSVRFQHSGGGGLNTGDAFRCVGASATKSVSKIRFETCAFFHNGRADITPIYNTDDLSAYGCTFDEVSDRAIGIELSVNTLTNLRFNHCFFNSNRSPGVPIVSLAGASMISLVDGVSFDRCFFGGGGFFSGYARNIRLSDCIIRPEKALSGIGSVSLVGYNENVLFDRCTIEHYAEQGLIAAVLCYPNSGIGARGVTFRDTTISQGASAHVAELQQCDHFAFERSTLAYSGVIDGTKYGISARPLGAPITSLKVSDCTIAGQPGRRLDSGIGFIADAAYQIGGVSVDRCTINNAKLGMYTPGTQANYADEPHFRGNTLGPGVVRLGQSSVSAPVICLAGERGNGNMRYLSGWGNPEGVVSGIAGCAYERRENGVIYHKSSGTAAVPTKTGWP